MAVERVIEEACNGCGVCVAVCPQDVLRMRESTKKAVIRYPDDCVACWSCEFYCPLHCIEVSESRPRKLPPIVQVRAS